MLYGCACINTSVVVTMTAATTNSPYYVSYENTTSPIKPYRPRLLWRARTIGRWRPYRRPISYAWFIRPQTQLPRSKCRDPPVNSVAAYLK
jgi:hypothetical protein